MPKILEVPKIEKQKLKTQRFKKKEQDTGLKDKN